MEANKRKVDQLKDKVTTLTEKDGIVVDEDLDKEIMTDNTDEILNELIPLNMFSGNSKKKLHHKSRDVRFDGIRFVGVIPKKLSTLQLMMPRDHPESLFCLQKVR